jgi:hypothetical protein
VGVNALLLAGVVFLQWSAAEVTYLYWVEYVIAAFSALLMRKVIVSYSSRTGFVDGPPKLTAWLLEWSSWNPKSEPSEDSFSGALMLLVCSAGMALAFFDWLTLPWYFFFAPLAYAAVSLNSFFREFLGEGQYKNMGLSEPFYPLFVPCLVLVVVPWLGAGAAAAVGGDWNSVKQASAVFFILLKALSELAATKQGRVILGLRRRHRRK